MPGLDPPLISTEMRNLVLNHKEQSVLQMYMQLSVRGSAKSVLLNLES